MDIHRNYSVHSFAGILSRGEDHMESKRQNILLIAVVAIVPLLLVLSHCAPTMFTARKQPPRTTISAFSQGKQRYEAGDYESASEFFLKATKSEPTNWLPYNWLGWTYLNLRQHEDALIQFKIANNLKEVSGNYQGLGDVYSALGDFTAALRNYEKYTEMDPKNWLAYNRLGWTYFNLKNYEGAIVQFKIANTIKEAWGNYQGLGQSYYELKDFDAALLNFRKYAEMDPKSWLPYNWLGWSYYNLKNYEGAVAQFKIANNIKEVWGNYKGLGESYYELGNYENAHTAFSNALKTCQNDYEKEQIKVTWAGKYVMQGELQKAYEILGPRPYLGIEFRAGKEGVEVVKVTEGSPASLAGLRSGDIMASFDGNDLRGITNKGFYEEIIKKAKFGSRVMVKIKRDGLYIEKALSVGITPHMAKTETDRERSDDLVKKETAQTGVRWAVIIGISQYQDTQIPALRYASFDAQAFYEWAVSPDGGRYAPSHVKLLLNNEATGTNIKKALFEWLRGALDEDMVTIYFAGHGSPESPDAQDNLFLLPYDTQYNSIATTGFPMWDIETALKRFIKAKKVVVIADACHSGGVGQSFDIARRANRGIKINPIGSGIQNLSQVGDGVCVISASSDNQFSQEGNRWGGGHGVFTYFLLKGLKGDADYNKNSSVSLGELTSYLSEKVRRETKNAQSPTVAGRYDPAITIGK